MPDHSKKNFERYSIDDEIVKEFKTIFTQTLDECISGDFEELAIEAIILNLRTLKEKLCIDEIDGFKESPEFNTRIFSAALEILTEREISLKSMKNITLKVFAYLDEKNYSTGKNILAGKTPEDWKKEIEPGGSVFEVLRALVIKLFKKLYK